MSKFIKKIKATNIYGRYDINQEFSPQLNILYGRNGTGKTTLLHIIANVLNGDYYRLAFLLFGTIQVSLDDAEIHISRHGVDEEALIEVRQGRKIIVKFSVKEAKQLSNEVDDPFADADVTTAEKTKASAPCQVAYFPAFRTMIEAWTSVEENRSRAHQRYMSPNIAKNPTSFARESFGEFVPDINYPSPLQIQRSLSTRIQQALNQVSFKDRVLLEEAFLGIFHGLSQPAIRDDESHSDSLITDIQQLSKRLAQFPLQSRSGGSFHSKLRSLVQANQDQAPTNNIAVPVLEAYRELLDKKIQQQEEAFASINTFLSSVNTFLMPKKIEITKADVPPRLGVVRSFIRIVSEDKTVIDSLQTLSSGERQILTLLYACTNMSAENVVLIDEPEISLHIDWQRQLLGRMVEQLGQRQIIVCTHSPVVGADYEDCIQKVQRIPSVKSSLPG